jgi:long-chain fatty acid transport protein
MLLKMDKFSLGFTLRTPTKIKFSGDAKNSMLASPYLASLNAPTESGIEREATWPLWVCAGVAFKPVEKLTITMDAQYTQWEKIDTIPATFDHPVWEAAVKEGAELTFEWEDKIQLRFGLEYLVSEKFALRGGYYYDPAPSPNNTLNILLPSITYDVITVGFGYKTGKMNIDFCFEYLMGRDRTVGLMEALPDAGMPGVHGMDILVPNIAVTINL